MENPLTTRERTLLGIIVLMIIAFILIGIDSWSTKDRIAQMESRFDQAFTLSRRSYDSALQSTQTQNRLDFNQAVKLGIAEQEKRFASIESQVRAGITLGQVKVQVPYPVEVQKLVLVDSSSGKTATWLKTPFSIHKKTKFNNFSATISKDMFTIDTNLMSTDLKINIGVKKKGLFSREPVVELTSSNPDTKIGYMVNYNAPKERKALKYGAVALVASALTFILTRK